MFNGRLLRTILATCVIFLLVFNVIFITSGSDKVISFQGFLQTVSNAPELNGVFLEAIPQILGDWGIFEFLRSFLNTFSTIINFVFYIINALLQLMSYVIYYCRALFLG